MRWPSWRTSGSITSAGVAPTFPMSEPSTRTRMSPLDSRTRSFPERASSTVLWRVSGSGSGLSCLETKTIAGSSAARSAVGWKRKRHPKHTSHRPGSGRVERPWALKNHRRGRNWLIGRMERHIAVPPVTESPVPSRGCFKTPSWLRPAEAARGFVDSNSTIFSAISPRFRSSPHTASLALGPTERVLKQPPRGRHSL